MEPRWGFRHRSKPPITNMAPRGSELRITALIFAFEYITIPTNPHSILPRSQFPMLRRTLSLLAATIPAVALAQVPPEKAVSTLKVAEGLQVELFASEPDVINPTSIDVDHLAGCGFARR